MNVSTSPKRPARKKTQFKSSVPKKTSTKSSAGKTRKKRSAKTIAVVHPVTTELQVIASPKTLEQASVVTDQQIGERAYQIWIENGRPYGQEQANWDQAVAELRG